MINLDDRLELAAGDQRWRYRVLQNDLKQALAHIAPQDLMEIPQQDQLLQNYPNPFNPETWMPFQLSQDSSVRIEIYSAQGRRARQLDLGWMEAGVYNERPVAAYWDGRSEVGEKVSTGVYFCRLVTDQHSQIRKMVILK